MESKESRRYFVTAGTGFIGREIVRQLLKREDTAHIVCLTRGRKPNAIEHPKLQYWKGDILDCTFPNGVHIWDGDCHALQDFTDLIHGANDASTDNAEVIIEGTIRVMKWAGENGIKRSLLLSSGAAEKRDTIYGRAKLQSESIVGAYGGKIARIYATIGPESPVDGPFAVGQFLDQARKKDGVIKCWGPSAVRTYIDVTDCARWLLKILDDGPMDKPIDVGGDTPITIGAVADLIGELFHAKVEKEDDAGRVDS